MNGGLCGQVVLAEALSPLEGAKVTLLRDDGAPFDPDDSGAVVDVLGFPPRIAAITDAIGGFCFDGLRPGPWLLRVFGGDGRELALRHLVVHDNALTQMTLEVSGGGKALPDPLIEVEPKPEPAPSGEPAPDIAPEPPIDPPRQAADRGTGRLLGHVVWSDGSGAVADAAVTVAQAAGPAPDIAPLTDADGRFLLTALPSGHWVLQAMAPDGRTGRAHAAVRADETTEVVIRVAAVD
ncbi:hypothetical protein [Caenispirillum salinarum]|uniref:hypothetical protein n=1 Tax=Caenispirillum salinarum TaxID=859058 RepID=UPI00384E5107